MKQECPNCGCKFVEAILSERPVKAPPEGGALELLRETRDCVAYCVSVDDGSWAQHNPHYAALLAKIDAALTGSVYEREP